MSEISRAALPSPKPAAPPANRSQPSNASEEGGNPFAALLSLVADTRAMSSDAADADSGPGEASVAQVEADDEDSDTAPDGDDNPVAQLLVGWADSRPGGRASTAATPPSAPSAALAPATLAAEPKAKGDPGAEITAMRALATPEAISPAALPGGAVAARAGVTMAGQVDGRDAKTTGTRRDAKAPAGNDPAAALRASATSWQPPQITTGRQAMSGGAADAVRGRGATWANSTVSMDLSATRGADSVAGNAVSLTARLSELITGKAQADGAAPTPLLGAMQDASSAKPEGPTPADLLATPEAPTEAELPPLSHWSTQQLRHAHLRLGDGGLDSLDIRLSMKGQDLSVDFRSDNAEIRQSLAQQANLSLASLLERSGIALADVSVGAQNRQPGGQGAASDQGQGSAQNGRGAIGRADGADPASAAQPLAQLAMRADGSRPLDLFV